MAMTFQHVHSFVGVTVWFVGSPDNQCFHGHLSILNGRWNLLTVFIGMATLIQCRVSKNHHRPGDHHHGSREKSY
jgi:hypothetical protein